MFQGCDPAVEAQLVLHGEKLLSDGTAPLFRLTARDPAAVHQHLAACGIVTHREIGSGTDSKETMTFSDPDGHLLAWQT